jgi:hypothetical protein
MFFSSQGKKSRKIRNFITCEVYTHPFPSFSTFWILRKDFFCYIRHMDIPSRKDELELLGLKNSEKKIILCISKMGKTLGMISRQTGIAYSSLQYMIKKLEKKSYVFPVVDQKHIFWRSNIPKITGWMVNAVKQKEQLKKMKKS